ncbi:START domain-containing protein [Thiomicrorhabdus sp.]|uniref:START domain-containing protein n=1 Tax=Thiomicrorhabdus sp. TaxID=2039724 RepID=UPI0029C7E399|nr:START domain-containing protein [Thiomicrorhabdus sp.]
MMNRKLRPLLAGMLISASLSCIVCPSYAATADWQVQEVEEGSPVQVWTKEVQGSNFKAFRGEVEIQAPIKSVLQTIHQTDKLPEWYHNTTEARKLKTISDGESINYSVTHAPWPVSNRDSVVHSTTKHQADGSVLITLQAEPNAYPPQEGRIRISKLDGSWKLQPIDDNHTTVTLQIAAEPGGEIPSWLANAMVVDMPFNTLNNLKQRLEKK